MKRKRKEDSLPAEEKDFENWEGPGLKRIKKRLESIKEEDVPELDPLEAVGTTVEASIVAKFEHCYLLRVQLGRETLHGVLYHAPPPEQSYPLVLPPVNTTGLALEGEKVILKRAPTKKSSVFRREELKRDRNAPRPARTGYNFFFSEARAKDQEVNPGRDDQERSAGIGEQWRNMTEEQRKPFLEMARKDKERYKAELARYQERLAARAREDLTSDMNGEVETGSRQN